MDWYVASTFLLLVTKFGNVKTPKNLVYLEFYVEPACRIAFSACIKLVVSPNLQKETLLYMPIS